MEDQMNGRPITEDDLHAFVDQALEPARHGEVADYLAAHPDVAGRVEKYRRDRDLLRAAFAPVAEEPVPPELNLARMIETRRLAGVGWMRAAAAAVLLLFLGGAAGWSLHGTLGQPQTGIAALMQEAVDSFEVYAPDRGRPVEIQAADQPQLVKWFSNRMKRPVAVPDLTASGYRFMGGRLVATPHGPAALFMYDDDHGTRLVMLSRPMAIDKNTPMSERSRGAVASIGWSNNGIGYSLVGPVSPDVLHPIANEVRKQIDAKA
jgi:anti-sigma factor RsiW